MEKGYGSVRKLSMDVVSVHSNHIMWTYFAYEKQIASDRIFLMFFNS
jgi:hypothetical protein